MDLKKEIIKMSNGAKIASRALCSLKSKAKNAALKQMARDLVKSRSSILKANEKDLRKAKKSRLKASFVDRLK